MVPTVNADLHVLLSGAVMLDIVEAEGSMSFTRQGPLLLGDPESILYVGGVGRIGVFLLLPFLLLGIDMSQLSCYSSRYGAS